MPVCIAGMHRSGTSMVARMLSTCGVYLGDESDMLSPMPDNPDGYWENAKFVALNDQVLGELGGAWDSPPLTFEPPHDESLDSEFEGRVTDRTRAKASELLAEFSGVATWGWKDPRNSLTFPFWKRLLPDAKVVICIRNPIEVILSLYRRNRFSFQLGLRLWHVYNRSVLATVPAEQRIITHFGAYFEDDAPAELRRVLTFLGMTASDQLITEGSTLVVTAKRHNRFGLGDLLEADVPADVMRLYLDMCAEAGWLDGAASTPAADQPASAQPRSRRLNETFLLTQTLKDEVSSQQRQLAAPESLHQHLHARLREQSVAIAELTTTMRAVQQGLGAVRKELETLRGDVSYQHLVARIRDVVETAVPRAATVIVVSKGDPALVNLPGRQGWHFPQGESGSYAGWYPAATSEAVAHIEALRAQGGDFLLFPRTAFWWLDSYEGLRQHLDGQYRVVHSDEHACMLYALNT